MNTFSPQFSPNVLLTIDSWESEMDSIDAMVEWIVAREGKKQCKGCKEWKLKDEFYDSRQGKKVYKFPECKICSNKRTRENQIANPEIYLRHGHKYKAKKAGVICVDADAWYEEELAKQDGKCAMPDCRLLAIENRHGRLYMDHDHVTGKFRGLICNRCNVFLAKYEKRKLAIETYLNNERNK